MTTRPPTEKAGSPIDLDAAPRAEEAPSIASARAFLAGGDVAALRAPLDEPVAEALVERLLATGDGERLAQLGAASEKRDKGLAKRARRAIHLLRTRGVAVEVKRAPAV